MPLGTQIAWLFILALPIASVAWTVTHEEIFREPRDFCATMSREASTLARRKFFYVWTCEYCFSHYVTAVVLILTRFHLLFDDWRGYLLAFLALPYISNLYMGLYAQTKLEAKKDRMEAKVIQHEAEIKEMEKTERKERHQAKIQRPAA
jgi:amino acid permease